MADEEATNESLPDSNADEQAESAEATTPESEVASPEPEESGADIAPAVDADAETDSGEQELSAAEQLAADALSAAREAVSSLDNELDPEPATEGVSADSPAEAPTPASGPTETGPLTGSMLGSGAEPQLSTFTPEQLTQLAAVQGGEGIDILSDVDLNVKIELGKTRMLVEDVLKLSDGAVVELDKLAGDPVDIYVNERHVARGEVLILNDNFCVRVSEILEATIEER